MRNGTLALLVAAAAAAAPSMSLALTPVKLGTAGGGIMVYYNNWDNSGAGGVPDGVVSGYDENPNNVAYYRAQFSYGNTDGSAFQFDNADLGGFSWNSVFSGQPVGQSQFGFDLLIVAPTYNPAGGVAIPAMNFADNVDNTAANAALTPAVPPSPTAWAINDYNDTGTGPGTGGGTLRNSLFRGTGLTLIPSLSVSGTVYTLDLAGTLTSDGLFHWSTPGQPDGVLATWGMDNTLLLDGSISYDKAGDFGADQRDFYTGNIDLYVQVPEPASLAVLGLGALGMLRRRK